MPCRFASSGTVAISRRASRAILALNAASNFLRDLVISVLHRLRQSRTLHTLTFGSISGVHFTQRYFSFSRFLLYTLLNFYTCGAHLLNKKMRPIDFVEKRCALTNSSVVRHSKLNYKTQYENCQQTRPSKAS